MILQYTLTLHNIVRREKDWGAGKDAGPMGRDCSFLNHSFVRLRSQFYFFKSLLGIRPWDIVFF